MISNIIQIYIISYIISEEVNLAYQLFPLEIKLVKLVQIPGQGCFAFYFALMPLGES